MWWLVSKGLKLIILIGNETEEQNQVPRVHSDNMSVF